MKVYRRLHRWLSHPEADRAILWLGFVLLLPSLPTGLATDDYLHTIMMDRPAPIAGFERAPLDIFRFCDPRFSPSLMQEGVFPWWDGPQTLIAFMRPLTAATHWLDHTLWRNVGWTMHLHSALWALLLKHNPIGSVAIFNCLIPIFGVLLSGLFLGESILEWKNLVALVLVSLGIVMVTARRA